MVQGSLFSQSRSLLLSSLHLSSGGRRGSGGGRDWCHFELFPPWPQSLESFSSRFYSSFPFSDLLKVCSFLFSTAFRLFKEVKLWIFQPTLQKKALFFSILPFFFFFFFSAYSTCFEVHILKRSDFSAFWWELAEREFRGKKYPYLKKASSFSSSPPQGYDYIIVGGGTAGCPLAATLSQNYTVLLLERGGSPYGNVNVSYLQNFHISLADTSPNSPSQAFISTDGVINARARVLGGGTCINAGFYTRASSRCLCVFFFFYYYQASFPF